jgi:hypothetical protein
LAPSAIVKVLLDTVLDGLDPPELTPMPIATAAMTTTTATALHDLVFFCIARLPATSTDRLYGNQFRKAKATAVRQRVKRHHDCENDENREASTHVEAATTF